MKKFRLPVLNWNPRIAINTIKSIWFITIGNREFYLSYNKYEYERNKLRKFLEVAPHKEWKDFTLWWTTPSVPSVLGPEISSVWKTDKKLTWKEFEMGIAMIRAKREE